MAKSKTNRSAAIRDYFKAHRKAKAQEVVDALAKEGIQVTPAWSIRRNATFEAGVAVAWLPLRSQPRTFARTDRLTPSPSSKRQGSWRIRPAASASSRNCWRHWNKEVRHELPDLQ